MFAAELICILTSQNTSFVESAIRPTYNAPNAMFNHVGNVTQMPDPKSKLQRRRQFLKNLDAFSRKPSLEQLEPRIVLNSSFNTAIDMGKLIVWKDGTPDKTVEIGKLDYGNGNILTLPDATYYVTHDQYGTWKSSLIDKAPIKIDSYGSGTITANANGELEFSDVSAYVRNKQNWDLLFKGDVTFKDKQRYSTQLADKTASSANDLQLTGMELEISKLGVISSPSGNHIARFQGEADAGSLFGNAQKGLVEWAGTSILKAIEIDKDTYLESDKIKGLRTSSQINWSPTPGNNTSSFKFKLTPNTTISIDKPKISYDQTLQELVIGGKFQFEAAPTSWIGKFVKTATGDFSGKGDGLIISPDGLSLRGKIEVETKLKGNDAKLSLSIKEDEWAVDLALKIDKVAEFSGGLEIDTSNSNGLTIKGGNLGIALSKPVPVPGVPGVFFDSGKLAAKNLENGLGKGEYNLEAVFNIGPKVEYELSNTEKNVLDLLFDDGSSNYNLPDKIGFKLAEVKFNGALDLEKNQVKLDLVKNIMKLSWEQGDNNYALLGQRYDGEAWVQWAPWVVGGSLEVDQFAYVDETGNVSSFLKDSFGFQFNVDTEYASHASNVEVKKTTTVQGSVEKKIPLSEILSLTDNKVITGAIKALANSLGTSDLSAIVGGTVEYTKQRSINSWSGDPEPWEYSSKIKLGVSVGRFTVVIEVNASGENLDNVEFEADWYTTSKNTIKPVKFGEGSNATSNVFDFVQDHDAIIFSVQFESNVPVPPYKPTVTLTEHGSNVPKPLNIPYEKGEDFQGSTSHPFGHVYTFRVDADSANSVNFENTQIVISSPGPSISNIEYRAFPTYFPEKITADYHFVGLDNQTGIMTFDYAICDASSKNSPAPDHDDFFSLSAQINGTPPIPGERVLPTPTLTMTENNCPVSVSNVGRVEFNLKDTDLTGLNNVQLLMTDLQGPNPSPWLERYQPTRLPFPILPSVNEPRVDIGNIQRAPRFNNSHLDSLADDDGAIDLVHPSSLGVHRFEIFAYDPDIEPGIVTFQLQTPNPNVTIDYDSGTSLDPLPWNGSAYLDVMVDPTQFGPYQEEFTVEATRNGLTSEETFRVHITPPVNQDYIIESIGKALSSLGTTLTGMSGNLTTWAKNNGFTLPHVNPVQQGLAQLAPYVQSNLFENPVIVLPAIGTNQTSQRVFNGERVIIQLDDNRPEILTLPNGAKNIVDAFNEALFANPSLGTRIMASTYVDPATNTVVDDAVKLTPIADFTVKSILYTPYVHVVDELLLNPHDFIGALPPWQSITFQAGNAMVTLQQADIKERFDELGGSSNQILQMPSINCLSII